jgi:parallel beta-helix repeat protein
LDSAVQVHGVANVTFTGLEIRYARGAGVVVTESDAVEIVGCTVSNNGMMGVNITNGTGCGVADSEVANNGNGGVMMYGGDRMTLTPSHHFVNNCTVRFFRQKFTLEDAIGSHACSLEGLPCV